jgi:preprotein translocase subunit SecE
MTNTRIAAIGYVVLAIATGLFLEHVLLAAFGGFGPTQPLTRPLWSEWTWCTVIGLGLTGAAAVYLWVSPKTNQVSMEIIAELRKVSWPSFAETRAATIAVIVASMIAAVLLGLFDVFWQFVTDKIQNPTL